MEVLVELSTAGGGDTDSSTTAAAAAAAGGEGQVQWVPRAVAHFVMVLAKSQQQPQPPGQPGQQQQQVEGPAWGVPAVVPSTQLEQQHYDTGEQQHDGTGEQQHHETTAFLRAILQRCCSTGEPCDAAALG